MCVWSLYIWYCITMIMSMILHCWPTTPILCIVFTLDGVYTYTMYVCVVCACVSSSRCGLLLHVLYNYSFLFGWYMYMYVCTCVCSSRCDLLLHVHVLYIHCSFLLWMVHVHVHVCVYMYYMCVHVHVCVLAGVAYSYSMCVCVCVLLLMYNVYMYIHVHVCVLLGCVLSPVHVHVCRWWLWMCMTWLWTLCYWMHSQIWRILPPPLWPSCRTDGSLMAWRNRYVHLPCSICCVNISYSMWIHVYTHTYIHVYTYMYIYNYVHVGIVLLRVSTHKYIMYKMHVHVCTWSVNTLDTMWSLHTCKTSSISTWYSMWTHVAHDV